jgi:hypothetical protein
VTPLTTIFEFFKTLFQSQVFWLIEFIGIFPALVLLWWFSTPIEVAPDYRTIDYRVRLRFQVGLLCWLWMPLLIVGMIVGFFYSLGLLAERASNLLQVALGPTVTEPVEIPESQRQERESS